MIKATMTTPDGRQILLLGLSHANLDRLRADGLQGYIRIDGDKIELPIDVIITSAPTEDDLQDALERFIGPATKVYDQR